MQPTGGSVRQNHGRVLIIGGGIGGLVTALALQRAGIEVAVFERAPQLSEIGAGITLWTNAIRALQHLDAADAVCAAGNFIERGELRSWRGNILVRTPVGEIGRRLGAPSVGLHRAVLQRELFAMLEPGIVRLNSACIGIEHDSEGVTAHIANGRSEHGCMLIGADGMRSLVRESLFGARPLRYAGHTCYRGIAEVAAFALPAGYAFESWGPARRFGAIRLDGKNAYWFANLASPPGECDPNPWRTLRTNFASWHAPIPEILESAEGAPVLRHDTYDLKPIPKWSSGRICLLGDAAHPMTPDLGQGACQAIEDAVVLARCLQNNDNLVAALGQYVARRWRRASGIVRRSHFQSWISQRTNPAACRVRNFLMAMSPAAFMDKAYEVNATFEV